ncbi:MAG TPA: GtrA family protein [Steroidobacteraceae bacterium]|nr:GtrA family protein [Steroidobacteraceae bacterium]
MAHGLRQIIRQFLAFGTVGVAGFVVDAGVLTLMLRLTGAGPYLGRVVSFLCAATFTWALNRVFTFRDQGTHHTLGAQWLRFLGANAIGGFVNFGVYSLLLATVAFFTAHPVAGVAAGSLAGLAVNFTLSRMFVFSASTR